ncbi:MAG: hypothetical protein DDT22_00707 [candidate division WS2 bacterium]|nr:hypothetical protein [Candidatus Lithacetigena glycinireducens]
MSLNIGGPVFIPTFRYHLLANPTPAEYAVLSLPFHQGLLSKLTLENLSLIQLYGSPGPVVGSSIKTKGGSPETNMISHQVFFPDDATIYEPLHSRFPYHLKLKLPTIKDEIDNHLVRVNSLEGVHNFTAIRFVYKNGRAREFNLGQIVLETPTPEMREKIVYGHNPIATGTRIGLSERGGKIYAELRFYELKDNLIIYGLHFPVELGLGISSGEIIRENISSSDFYNIKLVLGRKLPELPHSQEILNQLPEPLTLNPQETPLLIKIPLATNNPERVKLPRRFDLIWITDKGWLSSSSAHDLWRNWSLQELKKINK